MSYILDALKKADAQRERDPARGIHAQPASLPALQPPGLAQRPWFWVVATAGLAALAAAGWFLAQDGARGQGPAAVASDPAPLPTQSVAAPSQAAMPEVAATPEAAAPEAPATAVLPPPAPVTPPAPPTAGVTATPATAVTPPAQTVFPAVPVAPSVPVPPPVAVAAPAAEPLIASGLPPDAPKLAINGGVYSASRAQRMLIVNGQVVNEGADLGAGVVLEEIRPKAAVLRFRGGRYHVAF